VVAQIFETPYLKRKMKMYLKIENWIIFIFSENIQNNKLELSYSDFE
jgi:hypothetical protein